MKYQKLQRYLSEPRLHRFLIASGNAQPKAQKLCKINLEVSQSFYPVLNLFEIFFRNIVNYQISSHFDNSNWITEERDGFMSDTSLAQSKFFLKIPLTKLKGQFG
ncbi:hypothetical protein LAG90_08685 [Marinilongibacter aquaticus]|uniref:hypothetical protein n=1 Tax=Marinilongibacter aquaticus TaxID=2975157 RepID=UPI0021BD29F9|nr:hypothetical protein [Marinilongibacter aquaticus]UBM60710.1 hypothetical protein LAG90_08685 [Marinilongibacter aquaticus]